MSYILDALRKSDQERRRGAAPTLQSAPFMATRPEPRARAFYGVLALAVAAAFVIGWARPWHSAAPPAPVALKPNPIVAALPAPSVPAAASSAAAQAPVHPPAAPPKAQAGSAAAQPRAAQVRQASAARPAAAEVKPAQGLGEPAPREEEVPSLAELPASVRQELPQINVSVHAYSRTPKERLVGINDKLLHEGDALAPGLTIESITPEGMVLSYKGLRFRRTLP